MHLYNVTILLAALASLLTPLSALAIPIERSGEQPDCPALVEVFKASAPDHVRRISVTPLDLPESHLADPFKASVTRRKRLVALNDESDIAITANTASSTLISRAFVKSESAPDESALHNPFKIPSASRKRSLSASWEPCDGSVEIASAVVFATLAGAQHDGKERFNDAGVDYAPWAERKPDLTAVVGH